MGDVVGQGTVAYDTFYHARWKRARQWSRETIEARLAYAVEADKGGTLTGREIQHALRAIDATNIRGKKVLDYCCGTGMTAIYFALCGAEVWAFDASAEAIKIARQSAEMSGVSQSIHFDVLDAQSLPYDDDSFDAAFCKSALYIVAGFPRCCTELCRVLRTGGRAVFCEEGLGYNPFIKFIRRLRPAKWVKYGGQSLTYPDIRQFGAPFSQTEIRHFNLLMRIKTAFKRQLKRHGCLKPWSKMFLRILEKVDGAILRAVPRIEKYCGTVVVCFVK